MLIEDWTLVLAVLAHTQAGLTVFCEEGNELCGNLGVGFCDLFVVMVCFFVRPPQERTEPRERIGEKRGDDRRSGSGEAKGERGKRRERERERRQDQRKWSAIEDFARKKCRNSHSPSTEWFRKERKQKTYRCESLVASTMPNDVVEVADLVVELFTHTDRLSILLV